MRRCLLLAAALALVLVGLSLSVGIFREQVARVSGSAAIEKGPVLILDAGHGGEDGGAVSVTGVPESSINLSIVLKMRDLLAFCGTDPILLRDQDISLHSADAVTLREKKVSDLKNRVAAIQAQPNAVLLSIHQNSFPEARYRGTQVFFAPTEGSEALASHIQSAIQSALQPENTRASRPIPDTVFLMNHIDCPAALVECGFLTNPEEEALLRSEDYQRSLSLVLTSAWLTAGAPEESPDSGSTQQAPAT